MVHVMEGTMLKKQVRPYDETQSAWDVILKHFFPNGVPK